MAEFTGEYIVIEFSGSFQPHVVAAARARLEAFGVALPQNDEGAGRALAATDQPMPNFLPTWPMRACLLGSLNTMKWILPSPGA